MARWAVSLGLLRLGAWAGSGCNEQVQDLGPWIASVDVEKTSEGFTLLLELEGGDVAASSTETVEILIGRQAEGQRMKHFVLSKASSRKGVLEIRTEEDLLGGISEASFPMQATLAEYNGNTHGPEKMSCRAGEGGHSTCHRTQKEVAHEAAPSLPGASGDTGPGEHGHMMGPRGGMMREPGASPMHVEHPHMRSGSHPSMAGPAKALQKEEPETNLRRSFANPSSGHGFRMLVAGVIFVCVSCLCGALFLHRFAIRRSARNFDSTPKVVGKIADEKLSTVETMTRHRAFENDSDSEDEFRVW